MTQTTGVAPTCTALPAPGAALGVEAAATLLPYVAPLALDWLAERPSEPALVVDGTLAFADISGFTRLTEMLAARGKAGAEEMRELLNGCFEGLLSVAYVGGAELINWGGDAVLLLFRGDGHAARAVEAAWRMQRHMVRAGRVRTSIGPSRLQMSVGVHSGPVHFFLVGTHHRELVVSGPGATATAAMEELAEAGEIVVSPATAALVDRRCLGAPKGDGFLVAALPRSAGEAPPSAVPGRLVEPSTCLPAAKVAYLLAAPVESEHRQVAVGFVEFGGIGEVLRTGGEGAAAEALQALVGGAEQRCLDHGVTFWGTDIARDGGKVILVAGAPTTTDDDAGRILAVVRELVDAAGSLRLRAGVTVGRVFAGDFGPPYRRTYTVFGDAVNLAARLMAQARPGEVYASEQTLARSRLAFAVEEVEPFLVKGKVAPVRAKLVGAVLGSARQASAAAGTGSLLGRERELALLRAALASAAGGGGCCVELSGPPGIGKSRLLAEIEHEAEGFRTVTVVCDEYRSTTPYAPFRELARRCLGVDRGEGRVAAGAALAASVGELAPALVPLLPLLASVVDAEAAATPEACAIGERFRRGRIEEVFLELMAAVLAGPTLLVLDDAQWMDDASVALLRALAGALAERPWMVVVACSADRRGLDLSGLSSVERLELEPLSDEAVAGLLRMATAERPLAPHERQALASRSGGNPLFLLELLAVDDPSASTSALPDSVEGVLATQVDRLPPPERRLVRAAAVLGMEIPAAVLSAVLDEPVDAALLAALEDFFSPGPPGAVRFRHSMLRDAAYEGLSFARRRELHARAGAVLESTAGGRTAEVAGLLALHFGNAGLTGPAWRYARLAGERARDVYASVEAASYFSQALEAGRAAREAAPADLLEVAESLADARTRLGEFAAAEATYRLALCWAGDPIARARLWHKSALATDRAGSYLRALRLLGVASRTLGAAGSPGARRLRAEIRAQYGLVRHRQGRGRDAVRILEQAVHLAEEAGEADVLATALLHLDIAELTIGRAGDGAHAGRALGILRRLGNNPWLEARALNQLGIRAYYAGRWADAVNFYGESRSACERAGDQWTAAVESANIAEVLVDQGRLAEAEPILEEALRTYRAAATPTFVADATRVLARLVARRGEQARAEALLAEARGIYAADGESLQVVYTDAVLAEARLLAGDGRAAADLAGEVLAGAAPLAGRDLVLPLASRVLGLALLASGGDAAEARRRLEASAERARLRDARYELALSLQALADHWPDTAAEAPEREAIFSQLGVLPSARRPAVRAAAGYQ